MLKISYLTKEFTDFWLPVATKVSLAANNGALAGWIYPDQRHIANGWEIPDKIYAWLRLQIPENPTEAQRAFYWNEPFPKLRDFRRALYERHRDIKMRRKAVRAFRVERRELRDAPFKTMSTMLQAMQDELEQEVKTM